MSADRNIPILDEDDFASDSAVSPPSQQSVGAYIATALAALTKTGVYRTIWVDAAAMVPSTTSGAAADTIEATANDYDIDVLRFDGAANETASFKLTMPREWDGSNLKAIFHWSPATGASTSDGITLQISAIGRDDNESWDATVSAGPHVDDTVQTATQGTIHHTGTTTDITITGFTAGDTCIFVIERLATDGADTMTEDLILMGVELQYKESTTEPTEWS